MDDLRPPKEILRKYIKDRTNWITWDVNSYIYIVRRVRHEDSEIKDIVFGGGNLLSTLGLFSALNYLAKIYFLLRKDLPFTEKEISFVQEWTKENIPREIKKAINIKKLGELNETQCFVELMTDWPGQIGLDNDQLKSIWNNFRNKLTHVAYLPEYSTSLVYNTYEKKSSEIKELIEKGKDKPFIISGPFIICMTDVLNNTVQLIADWIVEEIENNIFDETSERRTIDWLKRYG